MPTLLCGGKESVTSHSCLSPWNSEEAVFHLLGKLVTQITCCDGPERARVLLSTEPPLSAPQQSSDPDASTSWEH